MRRSRATRLGKSRGALNGSACLGSRGHLIDAAVRHGGALGQSSAFRIKGLCAIPILFRRVVKETTASLKVGAVIGRTAGQPIIAKKRLGHG